MPPKKNRKKPVQTAEQKLAASWEAALTQLNDLTKDFARLEMEADRLREIVEPDNDAFSEYSAEFVEVTQFEIPGVELDYDQLYLLGRAKTKFDQYDVDNSGTLGTDEVLQIADWVWQNFEPNGEPLKETQRLELANHLIDKYDRDNSKTLNFKEFVDWFLETTKRLEERERLKNAEDDESESDHGGTPMDIIENIYQQGSKMTLKQALRRARAHYDDLDKDDTGLLEGPEVGDMAEWALRSFQPGNRKIEDFEKLEFCDSLMKVADANGDKCIDFDEFADWFTNTLCDIAKANKLIDKFEYASDIQITYNMESLTVAGALSKVRIKFRELDTNGTDYLEGPEVDHMGEWVWQAFAPFGKPLTEKRIEKIRTNLIAQRDLNKDNKLDFDEFSLWFVDTCRYIYKQEVSDNAKLAEFDQVSMSNSNNSNHGSPRNPKPYRPTSRLV